MVPGPASSTHLAPRCCRCMPSCLIPVTISRSPPPPTRRWTKTTPKTGVLASCRRRFSWRVAPRRGPGWGLPSHRPRRRETSMSDTAQCPFHLEDAPMALDRTAGWAHFRDAGDVFFADGIYFLTSAEAVQYGYQHPQIFSSAKAFDMVGSPVPLIPLAVDPPEHVRYRRILDPMLAPRVVNEMEEELRRQINELIDAFAQTGECDIVADVGNLYPTQVFLTLFGMPLEDRDRFAGWVHTINAEVSITGGEHADAQAQAGM